MPKSKMSSKSSWSIIWLLPIVVLSLFQLVKCQEVNDYDQIDNPAVLPLITQLVYSRLSNLTSILSKEISGQSSFCVIDPRYYTTLVYSSRE
ncbi:hypothetical protein L6164_005819 [Bauhinia variegata]|uniref:Uncharacterized protein n=1 Tax=Bauhinia variegata TaxID=167791 RepID=A0ACB9PSY8_BAUVA|nr:hypothetical protein L6164_005819 [Bauhinia variegata]